MSLLSWSSDDERELFTIDELKEKFSMNRVSKSAAVFDFDKLKWMNGIYIRSKDISELLELCKPYIISSGLADEKYICENKAKMEAMLLSVRDNFTLLSDAPEYLQIYFKLPDEITEEAKEILALPTSKGVLDLFLSKTAGKEYLDLESYKAVMKEIQKETGTKGRPLYMAVRSGVTRSTKGPEMDSVATLLSCDELTKRITETMKRAGLL